MPSIPSLKSLAAAAVAAALAAAAPAAASGPAVIVKVHQSSGVLSTYFRLAGAPGSLAHAGSLELVNPTGQRVTVSLDPVDAITTDTLGSAYRLRGDRVEGAARWLRLSSRQVSVAPHASTNVSVTVAVPHAARPGDYLAGVAVEALGQHQEARASRNLAVGEVDRYGVGVEVALPGARHPQLTFTGATVERDPGSVVFRLDARNSGNVILKNVRGRAVVMRGRHVVATTTIAPGTFVSATSIRYPVFAPHEQPAPGTTYRVRAELVYAGGAAHLDTHVTFGEAAAVTQQRFGGPHLPGGLPWWLWALAGAAAAAALLSAILYLRRRRRRLVSAARALAVLQRELAAAQRGGRPLSVVHLEVKDSTPASRRRIAAALRETLRSSDLVCDLDTEGLLVALPGTGPLMAEGLAAEIKDVLERGAQGDAVGSVGASTADGGLDPRELIAQARHDRRIDDMYQDA